MIRTNYQDIINIIKEYGITVELNDSFMDGYFLSKSEHNNKTPKIIIPHKISKYSILTALHELGHFFMHNKPSNNLKDETSIHHENEAWTFALLTMEDFWIKLSKRMGKYINSCLRSYEY